jgi:hypothetical protein
MTLRLDPEQRRWLIVNAVIGTAIVNLFVNLAVGWLETRGHPHMPRFTVSTKSSVLSDGLGALFTLPLITCLLVTAGVHRDRRSGGLARLDWQPTGRWWRSVIRPTVLSRGFRLGAVTFLGLALPIGCVLALAFPHGLTSSHFIAFHTLFTVVLGAIVTPMVALAAMTDTVEAPEVVAATV